MAAYTERELDRIERINGRAAARRAVAMVDIAQLHLDEYVEGRN